VNDEIKGQVPLAFLQLKDNNATEADKQRVANEINFTVRQEVGPIARLEGVLYVQMLPKTRTGKVMRIIMQKIMNGETYKVPATIEDPTAVDHIESFSLSNNYAEEVFKPDQRYKGNTA